jgi:hypothetical protein
VKSLFKSLPDGCDLSYKNLFEAKTNGSKFAREQCEGLWRDFHSLADNQFTEEFPFRFEQRWFEMYLGATLRNVGLAVSPSPKGKGGPDFCVDHGGRRFYVEAITPTQGDADNPDRVLDPIYTDADGRALAALVPTNQITMRLSRAFKTKADKYKGYREAGKIPQDATCIIAINSRDIPMHGRMLNRIGSARCMVWAINTCPSIRMAVRRWRGVNIAGFCKERSAKGINPAPCTKSRRSLVRSMRA